MLARVLLRNCQCVLSGFLHIAMWLLEWLITDPSPPHVSIASFTQSVDPRKLLCESKHVPGLIDPGIDPRMGT